MFEKTINVLQEYNARYENGGLIHYDDEDEIILAMYDDFTNTPHFTTVLFHLAKKLEYLTNADNDPEFRKFVLQGLRKKYEK